MIPLKNQNRYLVGISVLVILMGVLTLIDWQFDITAFKNIAWNVSPMNPVTAVTFIFSGSWLLIYLLFKNQYKPISYIIASIILGIGFLHFISYFFPLSGIRLDYLFFGDKIKNSGSPNTIAPNTAFLFLLSGTAMIMSDSRKKWVQLFKQYMLMCGFFLAYVSILGHLYDMQHDAQPAYHMAGFTHMAFTTGISFLLLIVAVFFSNPAYGLAQSIISSLNGGRLARRLLPFILIFPPLTGYFRLLGEKRGVFPTEFGVEFNTFLFTFILFAFTIFYTTVMNKRQLQALQSQKQISESEKRFRTLLFSMKEGVASLNMNGTILFCNPSFSSITGYSTSELLNKRGIKILIPTRDRLKFMEWVIRRSKGKEEDYKTQIIKKTGERIWVSVKANSMSDIEGKINGALITISDITEEVMHMQDLNAFTGSAAHDLNAPLSRILGITGLLNTYEFDEEIKMLHEGIEQTAANMQNLLRDLLHFSKLGASQFEKTVISLDPIVQEVFCFHTANYKGESTIYPLPPANVNAAAVKQLYHNLISNAVKYSSKSSSPKVEIGAYEKDKQLVYYVKDNGVGLNKEQIKMMFTPFKRFHAQFEGNGLGLVIVKRIIEKHGGNIWAQSEPGNGLTINFTLSAEMH